MADRSAWLRRAFERYHAGEITQDELLRLIAEHRGEPVSRETSIPDP